MPAKLVVDIHGGPHAIDRDAQRDILTVRADAARAEARAHADRGATPAAASLLRQMIQAIEASVGFVRDDGTPLAELREQLDDEVANYERNASHAERAHQYKAAASYTPTATAGQHDRKRKQAQKAPGALVGLSHEVQNTRWPLYADTTIGRSQDNEIPMQHSSLSRRHARVLYVDGEFALMDMGSTNGCAVNGVQLTGGRKVLADGDIVKLGFVEFRFEKKL